MNKEELIKLRDQYKLEYNKKKSRITKKSFWYEFLEPIEIQLCDL